MRTWQEIQRGENESGEILEEREDDLELILGEDSTALIPLSRLLPEVRLSHNALIVSEQRKELYGHILYSYSEASRRIQQLQRLTSPTIFLQPKREEPEPERVAHGLAVLAKKKDEIATMHNQDALEAIRVQLGLDKLRDEILEKIRHRLSFERGLQAVSAWTQRHLGKPCHTIRQANELFPHLTLSELAFFALLKELPRWMLLYGTTFDAGELARKAGVKDFEWGARRRVPQQLWATVHGLGYVLDDYRPEFEDDGNSMSGDPYGALGLTGIREDVQFVEYSDKVAAMVRNLIPLMLSNARLYEKVWQSSTESLQVGFGRIAKAAFHKIAGDEGKEATDINLGMAIDMLPPSQRQTFEELRQRLESVVTEAVIYDLARSVTLRADEVVRLVGILECAPQCLIQENPFVGFIQPYGASLRFIAPNGSIVEQCAFSPLHGREAIETIQAEMDDVGRENATIAHIFHGLFASVQGTIMERFCTDEDSLSLIEATALKVWLKQQVVLQLLPAWSLVPVRNYKRDIEQYVVTGKDVVARVTVKIGLTEANQIAATLSLMPLPLLARVKKIVKTPTARSIFELMEGMVIGGTYNQGSKTITLMEFPEKLYGNVGAIDKIARSFILLHECGEAVWTMLDDYTRARWKKISWPKGRRQLEKHFLTFYAHKKDEKEDFCDHFAAYLMHGPEFRLAASKAKPLKRKYNFLRRMLRFFTGSSLDYPRVVPYTIQEVKGAIEKEVHRMSLEEVIEFEEKRWRKDVRESAEHIFEVRKTFETLIANQERDITAKEDIEDPVERQIEVQDEDQVDDEDEECEEEVEVDEGLIKIHEIRESVTEVLESVIGEEEPYFNSLRNQITEHLLDDDWDDIATALDFLAEDDLHEVIDLLHEIEIKPSKTYF